MQAHSTYFSSMVELIPANYYVVREEEEEEEQEDQRKGRKRGGNRFWHNAKGSKEPIQKAKRKKMDSDRNMDEEGREGGGAEGKAGGIRRDVRQKQFSVEHVRSSTLSELHGRLQKKLDELRSRRKCGEDVGGKHAAQRKQKAEERKKGKDAIRRKREAKQKKVAIAAGRGGGEEEQPPPTTSTQLSFSRFEFNTDGKPARKRKNYQVLVKKAEANQKKLEEVKSVDKEKGERLQEKQRWTKAVEMARGKKMKDDPKLLKRTMRRQDQRKKLSQKKWEERLQREEERKESRQQKRRQNVQERTKLIKAKKARKRAKKKGKL